MNVETVQAINVAPGASLDHDDRRLYLYIKIRARLPVHQTTVENPRKQR